MGANFDQADLAHLREGAIATAARGAVEDGGVGIAVGDIANGAVTAHQPEAAVEGARRLGSGQGADDLGKQVLQRFDAESLPGLAQGGPPGGLLLVTTKARAFEDLADGQVGQQAHGQDEVKHDIVGQDAIGGVQAAGRVEGLAELLRGDNLIEARQAIKYPACVIRGQRPQSVACHCHSLPAILVLLNKHKIAGGCDLWRSERYCG
jgi:hypothetical protein